MISCADIDDNGKPNITSNVQDWRNEIIYQVLTDRFYDGNKSNNFNVDLTKPGHYHGGDWQGIIDKMDYLKELGERLFGYLQ